jgi:hypothetical protein
MAHPSRSCIITTMPSAAFHVSRMTQRVVQPCCWRTAGVFTVPHEYGHAAAARALGHRVRTVQSDFLDSPTWSALTGSGAASSTSSDDTSLDISPPPPLMPGAAAAGGGTVMAGTAENAAPVASADGRLGYTVYEPSVVLVDTKMFKSVGAYHAYAGALHSALLQEHCDVRMHCCGGRCPHTFTDFACCPTSNVLNERAADDVRTDTSGTVPLPTIPTDDSIATAAAISAAAKVQLTVSDYLEVYAQSSPEVAIVLDRWHDISNALGLALGQEGCRVFRAMGGAALSLSLLSVQSRLPSCDGPVSVCCLLLLVHSDWHILAARFH